MTAWRYSIIDIDTKGKDGRLVKNALECLGMHPKFGNIYSHYSNAKGNHVKRKFSYDLSYGYDCKDFKGIPDEDEFRRCANACGSPFIEINYDLAKTVYAVLNKLFGRTNVCFAYIEGKSNNDFCGVIIEGLPKNDFADESLCEYNAGDNKSYYTYYWHSDDGVPEFTEYCKEKGIAAVKPEKLMKEYTDSGDYREWAKRFSGSRVRDLSEECFTVPVGVKELLIKNSTQRGYAELTALILEKLR